MIQTRFGRFFRPAKVPQYSIEILSYAEYELKYAQLAVALGNRAKKPASSELPLIRGLLQRRSALPGSLNLSDTLFLAATVSILSPQRIIEIGTGTGFSSAVTATIAHSARDGHAEHPFVETIDAHTCYRRDENVAIGGQLSSLMPEMVDAVRVHAPRQSDFIDSLAKPNELELGFIDADHQHPCPLLDMLRMSRVIRPGGWILLHDIALGTLALAAQEQGKPLPFATTFGAEWLFQKWRFTRISGGNIGVIQVPQDKGKISRVVKDLLKLPFEVSRQSDRRLRREITEALRALE